MAIQSSGNNSIDALALSSWNAQVGVPASITYSFLTAVPNDATTDDALAFTPLINSQKQAIRDVFSLWSSVAKLGFTEVSGIGGADGQIRIGTNDQNAAGSAGYSDVPYDGAEGSYVYTYFDNTYPENFKFTPGSYGLSVFLHEIGHALGLKHPGNYNGSSGSEDPPFLPAATDNTDYSLMSYNEGASQAINQNNPTTPMLYDILAMQYLYGANTAYHNGTDTYTFSNDTPPLCIWDGGGVDTFDFSSTTKGATIDLRAGGFSSTSPGLNNVSIAYNVTIESVIGGSGADKITANDASLTISSGGGNDSIGIGKGQATIDGGSGSDTVVFPDKFADYVISQTSSGFSVQSRSSTSNITLTSNVELYTFSDTSFNPQSLNSAPTLAHPVQDVLAGIGKKFSYSIASNTFSDVDLNDTLSYTATLADGQALPSWLNFNASSLVLSGTPPQLGNIALRLTATDTAAHSVSTDFHLSSIVNFGSSFKDTAASDTFTGSSALDIASYTGNRADYTITSLGNQQFSVKLASGISDTLKDVERIQFADAAVALDVNQGHGGIAYGLYQAAFNRTPDAGGLGFWINVLDKGGAPLDIMNAFITSPEFVSTYNNLDNTGFVTQIYTNVLHRDFDTGGQQFWTDILDSGRGSRAEIVNAFTESPEFQGNLALVIGNGFSYTPYVG